MRIGMMVLAVAAYWVAYTHGMDWWRGEQASNFVWLWSFIGPLTLGINMHVSALRKPV